MPAMVMVNMDTTRTESRLCRTKICKFFESGRCSKGGKCSFAHGLADLQSRPNLQKTQLCMAFARNGVCREGPSCKYAHGFGDLKAPSIDLPPVHLLHMFQPCGTSSMNPSTTDGKLVKYFKDDDSWSVQTTDEGLEMELESLFGTSRQTSDWSAMSEDASNDQVVLESEFNPDCRTTSDDGSEADIKEEIPKVSAESLRKTKMCKYFTQGSCKRGLKCNFAHDTIYLKVRPNFFRTSLCLAFARSGFCKNGDNCKYAHGNNQLQNMPPKGNTSMASLTASGLQFSCACGPKFQRLLRSREVFKNSLSSVGVHN